MVRTNRVIIEATFEWWQTHPLASVTTFECIWIKVVPRLSRP